MAEAGAAAKGGPTLEAWGGGPHRELGSRFGGGAARKAISQSPLVEPKARSSQRSVQPQAMEMRPAEAKTWRAVNVPDYPPRLSSETTLYIVKNPVLHIASINK